MGHGRTSSSSSSSSLIKTDKPLLKFHFGGNLDHATLPLAYGQQYICHTWQDCYRVPPLFSTLIFHDYSMTKK